MVARGRALAEAFRHGLMKATRFDSEAQPTYVGNCQFVSTEKMNLEVDIRQLDAFHLAEAFTVCDWGLVYSIWEMLTGQTIEWGDRS